jgi:hypothetical protein
MTTDHKTPKLIAQRQRSTLSAASGRRGWTWSDVRTKFGTFAGGTRALGGVETVLSSFVGVQKYVYL